MRILALTLAALLGGLLPAQTVEERLQKLESEHKALLAEVERMQFGEFFGALGESKHGMGPAASKIYNRDKGLSLGGYGEVLYEQHSGGTDEFDMLRTVLYAAYRFDKNWLLNTEIEFEHAGEEVAVEFSYLEYLHSDCLNLRAGLLLVPMGFINEMHEPTTYLAAARPQTERQIIPSTWRETGIGAHGKTGNFDYRAQVITSLNGEKFDADGLRGGRQKGIESQADDFAFVGRLDWRATPDLTVGASVFVGDTGQDGTDGTNAIPDMRTTISEFHAEYRAHGLQARALYAQAQVRDTAMFNAATGGSLAERMVGYYLELGYDVMPHVSHDSKSVLLPFVRWEQIDTQDKMAGGSPAADPSKDETILTFGLHYRPIDQVVIKTEFQSFDKGDDRFHLGFGYVF